MTALPRAAQPDRINLLRRLSAQVRRFRQDLHRASNETLLLDAMEAARPLTPAERSRAATLRTEMWRLERELFHLRREYASLDERAPARR